MFEKYLQILDKLGGLNLSAIEFDPGRFVALAKDLPLGVAIALTIAGLIACLLGARRYVFRILLAPLAIAVGLALGPKATPLLHVSPKLASYIAGGAGGTAALLFPPVVLFCCFGILGALLGAELAGPQDYWIGFIPGFILAGALSLIVHRIVAVLVSSLIGAAMFVLGLLGLVSFTSFAPLIFGAPVLCLGLAGCVAVVAMGFQFKFGPSSDEEREKARSNKLRDKELAKDAKARTKRFKEYDKRAAGS
jgi:hypothetical protein